MKLGMGLASFYMKLRGMPVVQLITVGAKTGQERTTDLIGAPDGGNAWIVVASYAGSVKHPAWFINMARNPDKIWLKAGGRKVKVEGQTLQGPPRDEAWKKMIAIWPGYAGYSEKTDREIPVVRLTVV